MAPFLWTRKAVAPVEAAVRNIPPATIKGLLVIPPATEIRPPATESPALTQPGSKRSSGNALGFSGVGEAKLGATDNGVLLDEAICIASI